MNFSFRGEQDYQDMLRKRLNKSMEKMMFNSIYPKFVEPCVSPFSNPVPKIEYHTGGYIRYEQTAHGPFPELIVPAAPVEPEPVVEPESETVQTLRALVADRRRILERAMCDKEDTEEVVSSLRAQVAEEEEELAATLRKIEAAEASIASALDDIEKLGGRPEGVTGDV